MVTLTNRQPNNIGQSASGRWNGRVLQFTCSWQSCRQWASRWRLWWRWGPRRWARARGPARPPPHLGKHWKKCFHWSVTLSDSRTALPPLMSVMAHIGLTKTQEFSLPKLWGFCNKSVHILWFPSLWCQHNTIFVFWRNNISYLAQSNCCDWQLLQFPCFSKVQLGSHLRRHRLQRWGHDVDQSPFSQSPVEKRCKTGGETYKGLLKHLSYG